MESFPESIAIFAIGLTMVGAYPPLKSILFLAFMTTFFSFFIRSFHILFGMHTVFQLLFMILMVRIILKLNWKASIVSIVLGLTSLGILEIILIPIWLKIFDIDISMLLSNPWLRILVPFPHILLLGFLAWQNKRNKWVLIPLVEQKIKEHTFSYNKGSLLLIIIIFLQAFIFTTLTLTFYAFVSKKYPTLTINKLVSFTAFSSLLVAVTTISVAIIMKNAAQKEALIKTELRYLTELQNLYQAVRIQRHDFLNHVTSTYGLLKLGKFEAAQTYMETFFTSVKNSTAILNINIPVLSGLLQSKYDIASQHGIKFDVVSDPGFANIYLTQLELTGLLGNLIDNALDAAFEYGGNKPLVRVELLKEKTEFNISVSNTGKPINPEIQKRIFFHGFSTKSTSKHSGIGLNSVQNIVNKYKGQIIIEEPTNFEGTKFVILFPQSL